MSDRPSPSQTDKTDVTRWLPEWMLEERKQRLLAFLGAGLLTLVTGVGGAWHWYVDNTKTALELGVLDAGPYKLNEQAKRYTFYVPVTYTLTGSDLSNCVGEVFTRVQQESEAVALGDNVPVTEYKKSVHLVADGRATDARFRFYQSTAYYSKSARFRLKCDGRPASDWKTFLIGEIDIRPELDVLEPAFGRR
jgi:hypothetical protein